MFNRNESVWSCGDLRLWRVEECSSVARRGLCCACGYWTMMNILMYGEMYGWRTNLKLRKR